MDVTSMRTTLVLLCLALLVGAPLASAQLSRSSLVLDLEAPDDVLGEPNETMTLAGMTTFTGDALQYQNTQGIPIAYSVTKAPAWAMVIVSPSSDVIPLPMTPGLSVSASRPFEVIVTLDPAYVGDANDVIEITVTHEAVMGGTPAVGKAMVPVAVRKAPDECAHPAEPALAALAVEAADAYNAYQQQTASEAEEVTVQGAAVPVATPWVVLAGFALVGAGVGLALRRRAR